ncbi:phage adaptor protein [Rhizorhapis suberifaciens]|uniref:Uncharacterized protein n=1 Tax=Rhizorhapis suberifaciens TaxID=13656 RepID=A0A840HXT2_9SPHN|nr:hypothetical protein [Rhizorhapis suberifaciens]MBB4642369.1 hypothetical protein [Rhizorhapis suberifaciens]
MAILAAMQSASIKLIGRKPGTFFGASGQYEAEICDLINEVAEDVAKYRDWQDLGRTHTLNGNGTVDSFPLPTDYDRMLQDSDVQDLESWAWGYFRYPNINQFLFDQARGFIAQPGGWIIYGGEMQFSPAPATGATATFPYITKNWALDDADQPKAAFTADTDSFLLPERLLILALVWRWRENKKLDASGDQEAFIKALDEYAAKDGGSRIQRSNARRYFPGTRAAWPRALGPA